MDLWLLAADFHRLKFLISDDIAALKPLPVVRENWVSDGLVILALFLLLMGAAFGKTNILVANTIIGSGLFCGFILPFLTQALRAKKLKNKLAENNLS